MFNWLEKIRQKPLSKRRLIAFGLSFLFTGILFVVWLSVWLPGINREEEIVKKVESFSTPKDSFLQNISSAWQGITEQYSQLEAVLSGINVSKNLTSSVNYQSATNTPTISIIEVKSTTSASTIKH